MRTYTILSVSLFLIIIGNFCLGQKKLPGKDAYSPLENYVNKSDASFNWQVYQKTEGIRGTFYQVNLVSQTWQSIPWRHRAIIYFPENVEYPGTMVIVLRHLYNGMGGMSALEMISDSTGTPSAMLYDVPNQPLFDGKEEDDLQAYTFSQYIRTGDESWPLLFPMVKSVVRTMDVVQLLAGEEKRAPIDGFVIAGHSKRGHTAWLTAAADTRVKGVIPIAIDILNSTEQLKHHLEAFGAYSTPSQAATDFLQELRQPRGQRLIKMVDAYSFRKKLTLPKLIVSATNDSYFTTDALNLYWDGLKEPKWILYLSNANHVQADADARVNPTAFAFVRAVAGNRNLSQLNWKYSGKNKIVLRIKSDETSEKARLWTSYSKNKDFRKAKWTSQPMERSGKTEYTIEVSVPNSGYMAIFGEVEFVQDGHRFLLSTQTNISSKTSGFERASQKMYQQQ